MCGLPELIISSLVASGVGIRQQQMAQKAAETQARRAEALQKKQMQEARDAAARGRTPPPQRSQSLKTQASPYRATRTGTEGDMTIRRRRGKSALRVPSGGAGGSGVNMPG